MKAGGVLGILLAVAAPLLVGCDHRGGAPSAADSAFVSQVTASAPDITTYRSNTQLIRLGHVACDDFSAGASYEETADRMALEEGSHALPSEDLGAVITAAVNTLCPKYRTAVG
jgi:Protein of unknown function (DUF732)